MYSFHHYAGDKLAGSDYMRSWSNKISEITSRNFGVPLQMGEFTNYTSLSNWNYVLSLMNGRGLALGKLDLQGVGQNALGRNKRYGK